MNNADYEVTIKISDDNQFGYALFWYDGYPEAYCIRVRKELWLQHEGPDMLNYGISDSNGSGPESFTTWEAAKTAFLEAVAQQMMLDSTREMGVTQ